MADVTHRWPRATTTDDRYGRICECGNLKTDQALTCTDCATERRRAPDYWERRLCQCGSPKSKGAQRCKACADDAKRGVPVAGRAQTQQHPWRKTEAARLRASRA